MGYQESFTYREGRMGGGACVEVWGKINIVCDEDLPFTHTIVRFSSPHEVTARLPVPPRPRVVASISLPPEEITQV